MQIFSKAGVFLAVVMFLTTVYAKIIDPPTQISIAPMCQSYSQVAYNCIEDEYLVVWEEMRNFDSTQSDIWGQIVKGDGSLRGENFSVCSDSASQWWPHVDYDPVTNRYLVVFSDNRNAETDGWLDNYDVYGALLDKDGRHIPTSNSDPDTCFGIGKNTAAIHYPDVSYNYQTGNFLVVWTDYRNETSDIYGQIVNAEGNFLYVTDPAENFPVCVEESLDQDVPVVAYGNTINEWLVVFARGDWDDSGIYAQRVSPDGSLRKQDGSDGAGAITIIASTGNGADPVQPRAQFNNEYIPKLGKAADTEKPCECLITWQQGSGDNTDIFAQRLAFVSDGVAIALDEKGEIQTQPAFPMCNAEYYQNAPDIAFSDLDNEFMLGWQDNRKGGWNDPDFYCQRLFVNPDSEFVWLAEDRINLTTSMENTPIDTSEYLTGGNLVGAAHNSYRNEFFLIYAFQDTAQHRGNDLYGVRITGTIPTTINQIKQNRPFDFSLSQNYPNPFNPVTTLSYRLDKTGVVELSVFDINGKQIKTLVNTTQTDGFHSVVWDGTNNQNTPVASGIYIYKLDFGGLTLSNKMILVK
ncbi:T9SS type A sorting domain-containing protein [candidate division KSB1 bacterium]|nr:T9SS type A sorting domain-containing protein [candidate division KSB1 bacterium]